jgi:hypothetical protein
LNLGRALSQSPQTQQRVALQLLSLPPDPELLDEAAAILRLIVGGDAGAAGYANAIQALLAETDDPGLRKSWRQVERRIELADRERDRAIWEGVQSKRAVQNKMWRALRR